MRARSGTVGKAPKDSAFAKELEKIDKRRKERRGVSIGEAQFFDQGTNCSACGSVLSLFAVSRFNYIVHNINNNIIYMYLIKTSHLI